MIADDIKKYINMASNALVNYGASRCLNSKSVFKWEYSAAVVIVLWHQDLDWLQCKCLTHFHLCCFQKIPSVKWQNMITSTKLCRSVKALTLTL